MFERYKRPSSAPMGCYWGFSPLGNFIFLALPNHREQYGSNPNSEVFCSFMACHEEIGISLVSLKLSSLKNFLALYVYEFLELPNN